MTPTPEMIALAERIAISVAANGKDAEAAKQGALTAIMEVSEKAARFAAWAHMVPPDGGSPTEEECNLAALTAAAIRNGEHLR